MFVPSVLVLATYLLGVGAAVRLFRGRLRMLALLSAALLLVTVPFAGWHLLVPAGIAAGVLLLGGASRRIRGGEGVRRS
ncbi:hypothetical protein [Microbacterium sp.]|uniref:hypothetical protein n=1 Tax=Microbacterium sp. TaxID=51671 RepID=UPI003341A466